MAARQLQRCAAARHHHRPAQPAQFVAGREQLSMQCARAPGMTPICRLPSQSSIANDNVVVSGRSCSRLSAGAAADPQRKLQPRELQLQFPMERCRRDPAPKPPHRHCSHASPEPQAPIDIYRLLLPQTTHNDLHNRATAGGDSRSADEALFSESSTTAISGRRA